MAETGSKWANMEVLLLTTLLERHLPLDDSKQFGILRLVCKRWREAVGYCNLQIWIKSIPDVHLVRHQVLGSALASIIPGTAAVRISPALPHSLTRSTQDLSEEVVKSLAALPCLKTLQIQDWAGVRFSVEKLSNLQSLELTHCDNLEPSWLPAALPHLRQLTKLVWGYNSQLSKQPKDEDFVGIAQLTRLKELRLALACINRSFEAMSSLRSLKVLSLYEDMWMDAGPLASLSALTNLEDLDLTHCSAAMDSRAHYIGMLTKLTRLQLSDCPGISDDAMVHIAELKRLANLDLCGTHVSDSGLGDLSALTNLTMLVVFGMDMVTIEGLRQVPCMRNLTSWDLERALGFA